MRSVMKWPAVTLVLAMSMYLAAPTQGLYVPSAMAASGSKYPAQPPSTITLHGRVFDEAGQPLRGARVSLVSYGSSNGASTLSRTDGTFVFPGVTPRSYDLDCSKSGYRTLTTRLPLQGRSGMVKAPELRLSRMRVTLRGVVKDLAASVAAAPSGTALNREEIGCGPENPECPAWRGGTSGWFHGLPGDTTALGDHVRVMRVNRPKSGAQAMTITIAEAGRLQPRLARLAAGRTRIPKLSIVVRHDSSSTRSNVYTLRDATLDVVEQGQTGAVVTIAFQSLDLISALTANPGPPPHAPQPGADGDAKCWIHGLHDEPGLPPLEARFLGIVQPNDQGDLCLVASGSELEAALPAMRSGKPGNLDLIIVFPDRKRATYVEYKVWDATLVSADPNPAGAGSRTLVLRSPAIELLAGPEREGAFLEAPEGRAPTRGGAQ